MPGDALGAFCMVNYSSICLQRRDVGRKKFGGVVVVIYFSWRSYYALASNSGAHLRTSAHWPKAHRKGNFDS